GRDLPAGGVKRVLILSWLRCCEPHPLSSHGTGASPAPRPCVLDHLERPDEFQILRYSRKCRPLDFARADKEQVPLSGSRETTPLLQLRRNPPVRHRHQVTARVTDDALQPPRHAQALVQVEEEG